MTSLPAPLNHPNRLSLAALRSLAALAGIALGAASQDLAAQNLSQPKAAPGASETVQMDPFDVQASSSDSYNTLNSNSITAFNVQLDRMPLSADIFDGAFMADTATTSVETMLQTYSAGAGFSGGDPGANAVASPGDHVSHSNLQVRGFTLPYLERDSLMPVGSFYSPGSTGSGFTSNFDIERVEVIKGPQALLYSGGGAGAAVNVVSKQANFNTSPTGSLLFQTDQYGTKMSTIDFDVGNRWLAIRTAIINNDQQTRRVNLDSSLEGYYTQIAVKPFANTTVRVNLEETTFNQISAKEPTLSSATTDPRNGLDLAYLLASNQMGATGTLPAVNGGLVNWGNVNSWGGSAESTITVNKWTTLTADTQWTPWLSTQFQVGYNDFIYDLATTGLSFYSPTSTSNPLGVWAAGVTPGDTEEPGRSKAIRFVLLATGDFFNGKAHSQTVVGGDFLRMDAAQQVYTFFQADSNFNAIVGATPGSYDGRTPIAKQYWSIANGINPYPFYNFRSKQITVNGVNYVRQLDNIINPALESPSNPLGLSNTNTYEISKDIAQGFFAENDTQWFGDRVDTLVGIRMTHNFEESQQSGDPDNQVSGHPFDYNVGADFKLTPSVRGYVELSDTYDIPETISHGPDGVIPGTAHSVGEEVGLKFSNPNGAYSGSLAFYHTKGTNEEYEMSTTIENDIAPTGLNGRPTVGQWVGLDRESKGVELVLTGNPTPNLRFRFGASFTDGTIGTSKSYTQQYNDQFYENSLGQVTYGSSTGPVVYVPPTFNKTTPAYNQYNAPGTAVPLTVAMMNNPASVYYANPNITTGAINSSSALASVLKFSDPTYGSPLTGAVGLPITAIQIAAPSTVPGTIKVAQSGDQTLGYPKISGNFTSLYKFSSGWIKGASIGGTLSEAADVGGYYYYPLGATNSLQRQLFKLPNQTQIALILGYERKIGRYKWSTQLNVSNLLNHYDVIVFPGEVTGWSSQTGLVANLYGQPRAYVWTNTLHF